MNTDLDTTVAVESGHILKVAEMGQVETKMFHTVPGRYLQYAEDTTNLDPETVQLCWNFWRTDSRWRIMSP